MHQAESSELGNHMSLICTRCSLVLSSVYSQEQQHLKMLDYNFHISTARLTISHLDPRNDKHCDFVYELNSRPEMLIAHGDKPSDAPGRESGRKFIEQSVTRLEKNGYGRYLISRKPIDQQNKGDNANHVPFSETINEHDLIGVVSMQCDRLSLILDSLSWPSIIAKDMQRKLRKG
jgi:hypothetical protein